jgi:hypothetical protein
MAYIITEFEVLNCCCSSQRDKEVIRTFIGLYSDIEAVQAFALSWGEGHNLTRRQIRKGIFRPKRSCECGKFLTFDNTEPHAIVEEEQLFVLGRDVDSDEFYDLFEQIVIDKCCETVKKFSRGIIVGASVEPTKVREIIIGRLYEYSDKAKFAEVTPEQMLTLLDLIIQSGGLLNDSKTCACSTQLEISGSAFPCPMRISNILKTIKNFA